MFCLMLLIDAIKPNVEKKSKPVLFFTRLFKEGKSGAYKIKPILLLFALGLLVPKTTLFKRNEKSNYDSFYLNMCSTLFVTYPLSLSIHF